MTCALRPVPWLIAAAMCWAAALPVQAADAPLAPEFAWRGAVTPAEGSSLVRLALPPDALARLQTRQAHDVRVFNAAGAVVPYAVLPVADLEHIAPRVHTRVYPAWPLYSPASPDAPADKGSLEIRWSPDGSAISTMAWVRPGAQAVPGGMQPLPAVLLDLRTESQTLSALELKGSWPRNALVHIELASSTDLQDWTPIALKGPVFRFDGSDAPSNTALELQQPQSFQGRYLRLRWTGQDGMRLNSVTGRVATARQAAEPVRLEVGEGTPESAFARVWSLPFATPVLALHIQAVQDNTLVPLRISGRADATKPWRLLASTVAYRMDTVAGGRSNPAQPLPDTALRQLRLETSNGVPLPAGGLRLSADLAPVHLAFLASGTGPFVVAAGRPDTPFAGVDAATLASASATPLPSLPLTPVRQLRADLPGAPQLWAASLLPANVSLRSAALWVVLLMGVAVMAGVAYALLRQLNAAPAGTATAEKPPRS